MTVRDTVYESLLSYPTLYSNALDVYDHLFCVNGNGYEWKNGELVAVCDDEKHITNIKDAVMYILNKYLIEYFKDDDNPISRLMSLRITLNDNKGIPIIFTNHNKNVIEYVKRIFEVEQRVDDFSVIPDPIFKHNKDYKYELYPLCKYANICNIPDDVKYDWFLACKKMLHIMKDNPEIVDDPEGWIPKIEERINEIQNNFHEI